MTRFYPFVSAPALHSLGVAVYNENRPVCTANSYRPFSDIGRLRRLAEGREMLRHSSSSTEESILSEQVRKLFKMCDVERRGVIGKTDLHVISDLIPKQQMTALEQKIGEEEIDEPQFNNLMQSLVAESVSTTVVNGVESNESSPHGFCEEMSLADELEDVGKTEELLNDPLAEMIRTQLEENNYPYVVTNTSMPHEPAPSSHILEPYPIEPKAQFRPMEPNSFGIGGQSLADELAAAEVGVTSSSASDVDLRTPDRIFKVVFVGDSAVGKTCFLHRFCHNRFKPLFNATIGVDFTVKTIQVKDRLVALQLWDTAGQERFRAITKQYFRKADGVVLMFDVTSEQSLLNVRNWVDSVRAGVDDSTVLCLVGNKVDLFGNDSARSSVYRAGKKLAEEFGMAFFETSAFTGYGIEMCMRCIAERLQQREEKHLEEALRLEMMVQEKKRSWCCV